MYRGFELLRSEERISGGKRLVRTGERARQKKTKRR